MIIIASSNPARRPRAGRRVAVSVLFSFLALAWVAAPGRPAHAQRAQPASIPTPEPISKFAGALKASVKKQAQPLRIATRTLIIPNAVSTEIDHAGDAIVHVRAGDLVAVVDGKPTAQPVGTSFVVARGAKLAIETDRDSVIIQVVDVVPGAADDGAAPPK